MQKSKIKKGVKYCPQCGTELKQEDKFCYKCNYSFEKRKKKIKWRNLIFIIIAIIVFWVVIRLATGKNPIPVEIIKLFANKTAG
jgi:predicted nucleic acid-binding Zn ribbon protein